MLLIFFGLLLAILPLVMTTAFPHLMVVSIYSSLVFLAALAWAVLVITIIARRQRIADWRATRRLRKHAKKAALK
ncbi:MAG: hypothetical protein ACXWT7_11500 [Methylophilaceae bacterium]|jgi:hypothetical protein